MPGGHTRHARGLHAYKGDIGQCCLYLWGRSRPGPRHRAAILCIALLLALASSCATGAARGPVEEYRLSGKAAASWRVIREGFHREAFVPCLAKRNITVSCGGCTAVLLRGTLHIDARGRFAGFEKTFGRYCGADMPPDVERCFIEYFLKIEFPPELRGLSIAVDLGRGLKC